MKGYGLDLAVVDFGGSYVDFGIFAPAVVFQKIYNDFGVPITMEEARAPMGAHKKLHLQKISEGERVREAWKEVHGQYPSQSDVDAMFKKFVPEQEAVLLQYNNLIPGSLEFLAGIRDRGIVLGSTTGYTGKMMMDIIVPDLMEKGFRQDIAVASTGDYAVWNPLTEKFDRGKVNSRVFNLNSDDKVRADFTISRPYPHMCNLNAMLAGIPFNHRAVKIGDTLPDIDEGYRAGMWTIGLAVSGNEVGMSLAEWNNTPKEQQDLLREKASERMITKGADYVVDTIADVLPVLDDISDRVNKNELPRSLKSLF